MIEMVRGWFSLRVIIAAVIIALILLCLSLSWLWFQRSPQVVAGSGTAVLNVLPLPTETVPPPTTTPQPTGAPDQDIPPSPPPGLIGSGAFVQITGTGGDGLRLRSEPGLEGAILFLALESEVFQVQEGPTQADGYTWWFLVAPYDDSVRGWAASNFLQVVQAP